MKIKIEKENEMLTDTDIRDVVFSYKLSKTISGEKLEFFVDPYVRYVMYKILVYAWIYTKGRKIKSYTITPMTTRNNMVLLFEYECGDETTISVYKQSDTEVGYIFHDTSREPREGVYSGDPLFFIEK